MINLRTINWRRNARQWKNRAIRENGRIITNKHAAILIGNIIKKKLGLKYTDDEELEEIKFKNNGKA